MTVTALAVKGVLQLRNTLINPVAVPATANIKPHVVTVDAIIRSRQVFLVMEKDIALRALDFNN